MLCVRVFEGNSVFGACELITCAVPDYDYATRNGTEVLLTKRLSLTTVGLAWLPARERVLQFLVWCQWVGVWILELSRVMCQTSDRECLSLLSAVERDSPHVFSTVCILISSRIVRGPVVCSAHECSQQGRWLLDWSKYGRCCCGVSRTSCRVVVSRVQTLHLCSSET